MPALSSPPAPSPRVYVHAGFWWRVLAYVIDMVIVAPAGVLASRLLPFDAIMPHGVDDDGTRVVSLVMGHAMAASPHLQLGPIMAWVMGQLAASLVALLYNAGFIASRLQATPGKLACGLRVTDLAARRLHVGRALGRETLVSLAVMTVIGILMVGWTRRKQGLHDLIAGTLVLRATHADPVVFVPERAA